MSNRRKLRGRTGQPLPECPDCQSVTYTGTMPDGAVLIQVDHDPWCPSWRGITPSATERYALAEALSGSTVVYGKVRPS